MEKLTNSEFFVSSFRDLIFKHSTKFIAALLILIIGFWIIKKMSVAVKKILEKRNIDESLSHFLIALTRISLKVLLIFTVLTQAGVNTTSFIAALGAAGLAIGLALQGSLSNFAGGVLILFFKPFKIDDFIEAQGQKGNVKEIQIFTTKLLTPEGRLAIIPNGILANGNIINFTAEGIARVDVNFGIAYNADIKKAREVLLEAMKNHPNVMKYPEPFVGVSSLGDSAVNLVVRSWAHPDNYWKVFYEITEQGKTALDHAKIKIPFPQSEVRILS
jgi:small conductance mechanosensitive channel